MQFQTKLLIGALMSVVMLACSGSASSGSNFGERAPIGATANRSDFEDVFETFQNNNDLGSSKPVAAAYQPESVLPKLSKYFVIGSTLRPVSMGGFKAYILVGLPPEMRQVLASAAFGANKNTGFAVLQASFWQRVGELLDQGFHIGFVESDSKNSINGVFFNDTKTILVDSEADVGVLEHEYHHFIQYARLDGRAPERLSSLSAQCLSQASRYLAELDATTVEFHAWQNVFTSYDADPEASRVCKDPLTVESMQINDGQMLSLSANLAYPQNALGWVDQNVCPKSLFDILQETAQLVSVDEMKFANESVGGLAGDHLDVLSDHIFINTKCLSGDEDPNCLVTKQALVSELKQVAEIQSDWIQYVASEDVHRKSAIRKLLNQLPADIRHDLCFGAAGFEYLSDCQAYTGELPQAEDGN